MTAPGSPRCLHQEGDIRFLYTPAFDLQYLAPVAAYVQWKRKHDWDDYDEGYHAARFFGLAQQQPDLRIDSHLMMNKDQLTGVVFFVAGNLPSIETRFAIPQPDASLIMKYFHIFADHRGWGRRWLKEIVFPFYKQSGIVNIYVSSSHPRSFSLYEQLGTRIAGYKVVSDHQLTERAGGCYHITL